MAILWGVRRGNGAVVDERDIRQLGAATQRYADGGCDIYASGRLGVGTQASHIHEHLSMHSSLFRDTLGNVIAFDGRLDNHRELCADLTIGKDDASDAIIALAAYLRWGDLCFPRFTGDWALAMWSADRRYLVLAIDHAGTRTMYYRRRKNEVMWSTYLETFGAYQSSERLSARYAASYMSCVPAGRSTPYEDIVSVLPGQYITFEEEYAFYGTHWSPYLKTSIRYSSDRAYDEHFLTVFGQAVARRTDGQSPILAQLSGGMDSTSIVCMSDHLRRSMSQDTELLDTISFFDDAETHSKEPGYFAITEGRRGKTGIHFNTATSHRTFEPVPSDGGVYQVPGADSFSVQQEQRLYELVWQHGYRIILSGIGGDEMLGGVPTGLPELGNLLVRADLVHLLRKSIAWCLPDRSPLFHSLCATAGYTSRLYFRGSVHPLSRPPWLSKNLKNADREERGTRKTILERLTFQPHQLDNAETWDFVMETLPHRRPQLIFRPEFRYPMLDKDLVEFAFSIPREQVVRPGRRRALMRRALRGIVPQEILERKRKGFQLRAPLRALQLAHDKLQHLWEDPFLAHEGFVDVDRLRRESEKCVLGDAFWSQQLMRTVAYELWLRARQSNNPAMSSIQ